MPSPAEAGSWLKLADDSAATARRERTLITNNANAIAALEALKYDGPPLNRAQLDERVAAIAGALGIPDARARVLVSHVIVTQMLPDDAAVKGGIGIKLRLGEVGTRATSDMDLAVRDRANFLEELNKKLAAGWGTVPASKGALKKNPDAPPRLAFSGQARPDKQARPDGAPVAYLMEPYAVTLNFMGTPWARVPIEVGHDELGGLDHAVYPTNLADQIAAVGRILGFGELAPAWLIALEQQLAQKIHAVTEPASDRTHDLLDLQVLWIDAAGGGAGVDLTLLADLCRRTFAYRNRHAWPPAATMSEVLAPAYKSNKDEAGQGISIAETLAEACEWLNARIAEIDTH